MKGLAGKVACVTGAARGIGQAISIRLAQEGVSVAVTDITDTSRTVVLCQQAGAKVKGYSMDVRKKELISKTVEVIASDFGRLDIWVNNAGIFDNTPTVELSEELWNDVNNTNYTSMYWCAQAVIPYMLKEGWGRFVNLSSMAGKMAYPKEIAYCSSKAAVLGLTRALAIEHGGSGITSNAICPGPIQTEMLRSTHQSLAAGHGVTLAEWDASVLSTIPVGRFGRPEDVAHLAAFLASDEASFINGQAINIDGGMVFY
ncbi:MAG: SDR family oxidoreductase [Chloroflexi bacterium]|nr:MAG: SDR family oxidoreductase [Chloroflexota bacterium]